MIETTKLETMELGYEYTTQELSDCFKAIWGAVSWPGNRPGHVVVVGMGHEPYLNSHKVYLLAEYESFDMRKLIYQCGVLDLKYGVTLPDYSGKSGQWVGDFENSAADQLIQEMNAKHTHCQFSLNPTLMLEMESFYSYVLPKIKELLQRDCRRLFLKNSRITNYLKEILETEIASLKIGDYPSVESLGFAIVEMLRQEQQEVGAQGPKLSPYDNNILTRGLRIGNQRK